MLAWSASGAVGVPVSLGIFWAPDGAARMVLWREKDSGSCTRAWGLSQPGSSLLVSRGPYTEGASDICRAPEARRDGAAPSPLSTPRRGRTYPRRPPPGPRAAGERAAGTHRGGA